MEHLFLTAPIAQKLWKQFANVAGIQLEGKHLKQLILTWWDCPGPAKLRRVFQAVLAIVMWELWKRRNAIRHGNDYSFNWMLHQSLQTIAQVIKSNYSWLSTTPPYWNDMVEVLANYRPRLYYQKVVWKPRGEG